MVRFRCRNNKLPVSRSLFVPDIDQNCNLCNRGNLCDEVHVLLECDYFCNDRLLLLGKRNFRHINCLTLTDVLNGKMGRKIYNLAKFMCVIMSAF